MTNNEAPVRPLRLNRKKAFLAPMLVFRAPFLQSFVYQKTILFKRRLLKQKHAK